MDSKLQIITFIFSFIYGFIYYYLVSLNKYLVRNNQRFIKYIDTSLLTLDCVLLYVVLNYKINNGYFHIYFIIILFLGFILANYTQNRVKSTIYKLKRSK